MTKVATVYRFTNATLVLWDSLRASNSISIFDAGKQLDKAKDVLDATVASQLRNAGIYKASTEDLSLVESTWTQELTSYIPKDSSSELLQLSEEQYDRLTANFQKLYEKELSEPVETRTELDFELKNVDLKLSEGFLLGYDFTSELQAMIQTIRKKDDRSTFGHYRSSSSDPRADLKRNLPVDLSTDEVVKLIEALSYKIRNGSEYGYSAIVELDGGYRAPDKIKVSFLKSIYNGETRKVLETKRGGGHYADRRGHYVKDFSGVAGEAVITQSDVSSWWNSVGGPELSDDAKLEAITAFTRNLWGFAV